MKNQVTSEVKVPVSGKKNKDKLINTHMTCMSDVNYVKL